MSTVEVDVSIEERMVTVDRGPPSKSAKYKLLPTYLDGFVGYALENRTFS